jgi:hypothetical protein
MAEPEIPISDEEEAEAVRKANLFDIRRLIGALFAVYGVILIVLGLVGSHTVKHKADGINIDLWSGIGILVFAAFMVAWGFLRPVAPEAPEERGKGSGRIRRAPA